ncbi:MAG: hypothetical protein LBU65_02995 [Planctomycetaceae bacterium]|jgi:flagellar basal-body rod modification protein FlgD|nr:hypothetical protein [Planctomycetaceae bacterium]
MSAIYDYAASTSSSSTTSKTGDAMNNLTTSDFLAMMVAELQNQDPMSPMENADILNQINQIRSITSSDKLSTTLESVALGQSFVSASSLIGKTITGKSEAGAEVTGAVDRVVFENGVPSIYVGDAIVKLENITAIKNT